MKTYVYAIIGLVALFATIGLVTASYGSGNGTGNQQSYVDENGDGICDNWVDLDGDGINDNCLMDGTGNQYRYGNQQGKGYGPGDNTGHKGIGPRDGTGFGPGNCQEK
jgi:hypothetical protein